MNIYSLDKNIILLLELVNIVEDIFKNENI